MLIRLLLIAVLLQIIFANVERKLSDKDHYRVCFKFYLYLFKIKIIIYFFKKF